MGKPERLDGADGIRGLACLTVLLTHAVSMFFVTAAGRHLAGTGKIGVWLFFVLSALLLTHKFKATGFGTGRLAAYALGRFLRIIPLFAFAVMVHFWFGYLGIISWADVMAALTFQKGYAHLWTVPVEFTFYLWLPLVAGAFVVARGHSIHAACILLAVLILCQQLVWPYWNTPINAIATGWYLSSFTIGCFLAVVLDDIRPKITNRLANLLAISVVLGLILASPGARHAVFGVPLDLAIVDKFVYISAAWALFIIATIDGKGLFGSLVTRASMRRIGAWSYSIYLFHFMIFVALSSRYPDSVYAMLAAIAASIVIGAASFNVIERNIEKIRPAAQSWVLGRFSSDWRPADGRKVVDDPRH